MPAILVSLLALAALLWTGAPLAQQPTPAASQAPAASPSDTPAVQAPGARPAGNPAPWRPNTDTLPYRGTSAGGGYSTVNDLVRFARRTDDP